MKFKNWLENLRTLDDETLDDEILGKKNFLGSSIFDQKAITQQSNISQILGFVNPLVKVAEGTFATLYQHPDFKDRLIKVTAHKSDVQNIVKAQRLNSHNIVRVFNWHDGSLIKAVPALNSLAIIIEKIQGKTLPYATNHFYDIIFDGNFELAKDWIDAGGNPKQKKILSLYKKNNDKEHEKLSDLFGCLDQLQKNYRIDLVDFQDNILDNGSRYVIVDMGF